MPPGETPALSTRRDECAVRTADAATSSWHQDASRPAIARSHPEGNGHGSGGVRTDTTAQRIHQVGILVTQAAQEVFDSQFVLRELPAAPIRGITDPVVTFAVERFEP